MKITQSQLVKKLMQTKGATFATFITKTVPTLDKSNPFGDNICKISVVNATLNFVYTNAVNNQREREGLTTDFTAQPRKWGEKVVGTPLVIHKGKYYLEAKVEKSIEHSYETLDGQSIPKHIVERFTKKSHSNTQGTEKEIIVRSYALDNIISINVFGEKFEIVD